MGSEGPGSYHAGSGAEGEEAESVQDIPRDAAAIRAAGFVVQPSEHGHGDRGTEGA